MNRIFRKICKVGFANDNQQIGGVGHTVEVDESRFGPGYNSKKSQKGYWVLGGLDRATERRFAVIVTDRSADTLIGDIKKHVLPGTTIHTDFWASYNRLNQEGYAHRSVNHRYNFVDQNDGTHTQGIEKMWGTLKTFLPKGGKIKDQFDEHFATYWLYQQYREERLISVFLRALNQTTPENIHNI